MNMPMTLVEITILEGTVVNPLPGGVRLRRAHVRALGGGPRAIGSQMDVEARGRIARLMTVQPFNVGLVVRGHLRDGVLHVVPDAEEMRYTVSLAA